MASSLSSLHTASNEGDTETICRILREEACDVNERDCGSLEVGMERERKREREKEREKEREREDSEEIGEKKKIRL